MKQKWETKDRFSFYSKGKFKIRIISYNDIYHETEFSYNGLFIYKKYKDSFGAYKKRMTNNTLSYTKEESLIELDKILSMSERRLYVNTRNDGFGPSEGKGFKTIYSYKKEMV